MEEEIVKQTPEDEALRLASRIIPITTESILGVESIHFNRRGILQLAFFIRSGLSKSDILDKAVEICEDFKPLSSDSDFWDEIWFSSLGIRQFIEWCKPPERDIFNF